MAQNRRGAGTRPGSWSRSSAIRLRPHRSRRAAFPQPALPGSLPCGVAPNRAPTIGVTQAIDSQQKVATNRDPKLRRTGTTRRCQVLSQSQCITSHRNGGLLQRNFTPLRRPAPRLVASAIECAEPRRAPLRAATRACGQGAAAASAEANRSEFYGATARLDARGAFALICVCARGSKSALSSHFVGLFAKCEILEFCCIANDRIRSRADVTLCTSECPLRHFDCLKPPVRSREEFRTPVGVRKSPRNEPAGRMRRPMGI
jgi:hypothetical protein